MKLIKTADLRDVLDSYNREEISYAKMVDILNEKANERLKAINYSQCCTQLPIKELPNCNRVEVIDQNGRSYVNWKPTNKVRLSMQDEGRTAKIFID